LEQFFCRDEVENAKVFRQTDRQKVIRKKSLELSTQLS
jgi:hypothetical protein